MEKKRRIRALFIFVRFLLNSCLQEKIARIHHKRRKPSGALAQVALFETHLLLQGGGRRSHLDDIVGLYELVYLHGATQ